MHTTVDALIAECAKADAARRALYAVPLPADASAEQRRQHARQTEDAETRAGDAYRALERYCDNTVAEAYMEAREEFTSLESEISHGSRFDSQADWEAFRSYARGQAAEINRMHDEAVAVRKALDAAGHTIATISHVAALPPVAIPDLTWEQVNTFNADGLRRVGGHDNSQWVEDRYFRREPQPTA
jgi:hypothetical protein